MPVRSRSTLLAGVTALLGLCIAGSGCHSNLVDQYKALPQLGPPPASSGARLIVPVPSAPAGVQQVSMPGALPALPPTAAPPAVTPDPAPYTPPAPAARIGRPVRRRGIFTKQPSPTPEPALTWRATNPQKAPPSTPIRRVSTGMPLGAMDKPYVVGFISRTAGPDLPQPMPVGGQVSARAAPPVPGPSLDLPRPRITPQPQPSMPGPGISHPMKAPGEFHMRAYSAYVVEPPDVLAIELSPTLNEGAMPISGPHLVRPDGTVGLGAIGSVFVAGMTLDNAKEQILQAIYSRRSKEKGKDGKEPPTLDDFRNALKVDVQAYNSKFYYVVTDGGGYGAQVIKVPCTGNEKVLDAIASIQGLPAVASPKRIWIARATPGGHQPNILPVDFHGITQVGSAATNYQLYPGDRLFVHSDPRIRLDSGLAKILAPVERVLGVTLLGAGTVNTIRNGNVNGLGGGFR